MREDAREDQLGRVLHAPDQPARVCSRHAHARHAGVDLDLDRDVADGLWIAQDTGGAIKGANRFDTFWGNGADAREIAGGMSGRGRALILLPKGTLARLQTQ